MFFKVSDVAAWLEPVSARTILADYRRGQASARPLRAGAPGGAVAADSSHVGRDHQQASEQPDRLCELLSIRQLR